jgi:hypothetical protein
MALSLSSLRDVEVRGENATIVSKELSCPIKRGFLARLGEDGDSMRRFFFLPFSYSGGIKPLAEAANGCKGGDATESAPLMWPESWGKGMEKSSGPGDDAGDESLYAVGEEGGDGATDQRVSSSNMKGIARVLSVEQALRRLCQGQITIT